MFWFIVGAVLILAGLAALLYRRTIQVEPDSRHYADQVLVRRISAGLAVVTILLGSFTVFWDSFTIIPARNVGVVNTFGSANRTLANGWSWVWPWSSVETVDATVKTVRLTTDLDKWAHGVCTGVTVRLANQTTACLDVTYQWNIPQNTDVNALWSKYRGSNDDLIGNLQNNLVDPQMRSAASRVYVSYNPLAALDPNNTAPIPTTTALSAQTEATLKTLVPDSISIDSLTVSGVVHFDAVTQQKLNAYAQALADTQIATQQKLTAVQQKLANEQLAASTSTDDPGVLYQNCLNLIKALAASNQLDKLPPTFNCAGSGSTPVIVGQK